MALKRNEQISKLFKNNRLRSVTSDKIMLTESLCKCFLLIGSEYTTRHTTKLLAVFGHLYKPCNCQYIYRARFSCRAKNSE